MLTLGANAVPIFFGGGGGGGGNNRPKCRYVAQTAYFPTYDTVYKQVIQLSVLSLNNELGLYSNMSMSSVSFYQKP